MPDRAPWDDHKLSARGLAMLSALEGSAQPPYKDEAGYWTAGVGHRIAKKADGKDWKADWSRWLQADTAEAARCVNDLVKLPLKQTEADALIMLIFNIGCEAFRGSHLRKAINEGKPDGAMSWWLIWHYEHGKPSNGLLARRHAEWKLFSEGTYSRA